MLEMFVVCTLACFVGSMSSLWVFCVVIHRWDRYLAIDIAVELLRLGLGRGVAMNLDAMSAEPEPSPSCAPDEEYEEGA